MHLIRFKEKYCLKFDECYGFETNLSNIEIKVIDRINLGLKKTTFRTHPFKLGNYRIVQGSYFKPKIETKFYLHIFLVEKISIEKLNDYHIKMDLGLTQTEFEKLVGNWYLNTWFFDAFQKINKKEQVEIDEPYYLCHFERKFNNNKALKEFF